MDILRKAIFLGLGALTLTREKAESLVDELIKKGEVASSEKYKTIDKLLKESDRIEQQFQEKVNSTVEKTISDMGIPTRKDWEDLRETLKRIEMKLSMAERREAG